MDILLDGSNGGLLANTCLLLTGSGNLESLVFMGSDNGIATDHAISLILAAFRKSKRESRSKLWKIALVEVNGSIYPNQ